MHFHPIRAFKAAYAWKSPVEKTKTNEVSLIFWLVALGMFLIRFLWVGQLLKWAYRTFKPPEPKVDIPPWLMESYLFLSIFLEIVIGILSNSGVLFFRPTKTTILIICVWKIVETVSSNWYYLLLRPILERKSPHSTSRSFLMAVISMIEVWWVLCLLWYFVGNVSPQLKDLIDAIYFTSVTFFTVGYGDISPQAGEGRLLAVFTMFSAVSMLTIVLSRAISLVQPLPQDSK